MQEQSPSRVILHLDADAFFVSCEISRNPDLRGAPVAVGGSARGVIVSANYEARACGVSATTPTARAMEICPALIVLPVNHGMYAEISGKMFGIARDCSPWVEECSIDEGYVDLSGIQSTSPRQTAESLRSRYNEELGISVSMGLASNKLLAAIASKLRKPDSLVEVPPGRERDFLAPLEVKWLPGVGEKTEKILHNMDIRHISDINDCSLEKLTLALGSSAPRLKKLAMGIDQRPLLVDTPDPKSYSSQETFSMNICEKECVGDTLKRMADDLMAKLRFEKKMTSGIEVVIRHGDMSQRSCRETLAEPTDLETDVYPAIERLLDRVWIRPCGLRLVGLKVFQVRPAPAVTQVELGLPGLSRKPRRDLAQAMDFLRHRFGDQAAMRGHKITAPSH